MIFELGALIDELIDCMVWCTGWLLFQWLGAETDR